MTIGKKQRFEVFKRDKFTCQYCGRSAPDVILQADHIHPVSGGGTDDMVNLVTSCRDCNLGKSSRLLSDDAIVKQQKRQLDELQERREQLEMMMEWQRSLIDIEGQAVEELATLWDDLVPGYCLNDKGLRNLRRWARKYGINAICEAMRTAADTYLRYDSKGQVTRESVENAWKRVPGICHNREQEGKKPYLKDLYYIRGIVRNRMYCNEWQALKLLEEAYLCGLDIESLKGWAKEARNWSTWKAALTGWIEAEKPKDAVG